MSFLGSCRANPPPGFGVPLCAVDLFCDWASIEDGTLPACARSGIGIYRSQRPIGLVRSQHQRDVTVVARKGSPDTVRGRRWMLTIFRNPVT